MSPLTVENIDWKDRTAELDARGWAVLPGLLSADQCAETAMLYDAERMFRSHVRMARHGFGRGEYKYFAYPLPPQIQSLRMSLYPHLAQVANDWHRRLASQLRFPQEHAEYLSHCHAAGQSKPTPLLLRYARGDFNCLHQDLYGDEVFPLQVAILLSRPGEDFTGGEFVLTEQRPRMQSRVEVVSLRQGDAVVFAVNHRPVEGTRNTYRVKLRHGVSTISAGLRHTLGVIFHDAQ